MKVILRKGSPIYGFVYNNRGKFTTTPYRGRLFASISSANYYRRSFLSQSKKKLKLVKLTIEIV